ncbi:unnamed protein product [Brassica napus]|uniref:(rape) hypothetical protein n=1 Tax=Brassica napus TaxID=3708 RepID=A0A816S025_BRANA|nr:unnamed protein product [Brassica napus]
MPSPMLLHLPRLFIKVSGLLCHKKVFWFFPFFSSYDYNVYGYSVS